jgi:hypothetical protein
MSRDPVQRARASLGEARRLLLRPTAGAIEESAAHIKAAVDALRGVPASETAALRKEAAIVTALFEGAAAFYFGWARVLFTAACGYTASGEPAPPGPLRRVSVEG